MRHIAFCFSFLLCCSPNASRGSVPAGLGCPAASSIHAHSLGLRADWVIDPTNDQTGAFWPGEPHRADVILEARADLRSDQPVACGGLRALQGPQPPALAVVANSPARCSSLISLTNHEPVPLERCPQHMRGSPTRCKMGAQRQCAACCQRVAAMAMANGPAGRHG